MIREDGMKEDTGRETVTERLVRQRMASPDPSLLREIRGCRWTSHNIPLTPTESTRGSDSPLIGQDTRMRVVRGNLRRYSGGRGSLAGKKIIDLGCLEGGMSFELSKDDADVLGVEGKEENYHKCRLIEQYFGLPNLRFRHLDVKDIPRDSGPFDIVLCCGLLYHLSDPVSFLDLLDKITHDSSILFLDTHIAPSEGPLFDRCCFRDRLSGFETLTTGGIAYRGRWFVEYDEAAGRSDHPWAAVSNSRSFWLDHDSLMKALYRNGFKSISVLYGMTDIDKEFALREEYSRLFCVAVKEPWDG
jgi:2-polyprenyl-3-methyl-5-hydroxy-6-metoxy-1,4-benzoquinol methylase